MDNIPTDAQALPKRTNPLKILGAIFAASLVLSLIVVGYTFMMSSDTPTAEENYNTENYAQPPINQADIQRYEEPRNGMTLITEFDANQRNNRETYLQDGELTGQQSTALDWLTSLLVDNRTIDLMPVITDDEVGLFVLTEFGEPEINAGYNEVIYGSVTKQNDYYRDIRIDNLHNFINADVIGKWTSTQFFSYSATKKAVILKSHDGDGCGSREKIWAVDTSKRVITLGDTVLGCGVETGDSQFGGVLGSKAFFSEVTRLNETDPELSQYFEKYWYSKVERLYTIDLETFEKKYIPFNTSDNIYEIGSRDYYADVSDTAIVLKTIDGAVEYFPDRQEFGKQLLPKN